MVRVLPGFFRWRDVRARGTAQRRQVIWLSPSFPRKRESSCHRPCPSSGDRISPGPRITRWTPRIDKTPRLLPPRTGFQPNLCRVQFSLPIVRPTPRLLDSRFRGNDNRRENDALLPRRLSWPIRSASETSSRRARQPASGLGVTVQSAAASPRRIPRRAPIVLPPAFVAARSSPRRSSRRLPATRTRSTWTRPVAGLWIGEQKMTRPERHHLQRPTSGGSHRARLARRLAGQHPPDGADRVAQHQRNGGRRRLHLDGRQRGAERGLPDGHELAHRQPSPDPARAAAAVMAPSTTTASSGSRPPACAPSSASTRRAGPPSTCCRSSAGTACTTSPSTTRAPSG